MSFLPSWAVLIKIVGRLTKHIPRDNMTTYQYLLEKECTKAFFKSDKDLLSHCKDKGDWYHSVYATFLSVCYFFKKITQYTQAVRKKGEQ